MAGVADQKSPSVREALGGALVHFEIRNPLQIVEADVGTDPGIEQRSDLISGRKRAACIGLIAIDEDKPAAVRERRTARRNVLEDWDN